jgi:hypothetical protein
MFPLCNSSRRFIFPKKILRLSSNAFQNVAEMIIRQMIHQDVNLKERVVPDAAAV